MKTLQAMNRFGQRFTLMESNVTKTRILQDDNEITVDMNIDQVAIAWKMWTNMGVVIQDAFPTLTTGQREFLMTGTTQEAWDAMFKHVEGTDH